MSKLTAKQTILLGESISAINIAIKVAKHAEEKLEELEASLSDRDTPFSEAVCDAVGDMGEVMSNLKEAESVCDFAYENEGERRVAKMLRGMRH